MVSSAKKKEYNVSYSSEIQKGFAFTASGPTSVADYKHKFCWIICDKNLSFAAEVADDIRHHSETKIHEGKARQKTSISFWGCFI